MTTQAETADRAKTGLEPTGSKRLASLDVFRGITVFAMIVVNSPGSWSSVYAPLRHARWNGWTPTDQVFPSFLFIVGVSICLALGGKVERGESTSKLLLRIAIRSIVLFGLGLVLNGFPSFKFETYRIPGVLQRIALCYFFGSLVFLSTRTWLQSTLVVVLLLGYWALMSFVAAPGMTPGDLSASGNLAAHVDRALMGKHIYKPHYDPEGLLSTLPALATTILGMLTGTWIRSRQNRGRSIAAGSLAMALTGAAGIAAGLYWHGLFPINKALWTSSFVVFTSGASLILLAICQLFVDGIGMRFGTQPFMALGANAIAAYVLSSLGTRLLGMVELNDHGHSTNLHQYSYDHLFATWLPPHAASLGWAVVYASLIAILATLAWKKNIVIKV